MSGTTPLAGAGGPEPTPSLPSHHIPNPGSGPRFRNPWDEFEARNFSDVWKWERSRSKSGTNRYGHLVGIPNPTDEDFRRAFPLNPVDWDAVAHPPAGGIQAVMVGHATVFVQMGGVNFITDPVFSERCAPVQFIGPRRKVPPAFTADEPRLPALDFVLLSHNHYDHLDSGSVKQLTKRYGKALRWYVPLGLRPWFEDEGVRNVVELDWWQSALHTSEHTGKSVTVTLVPAMHWSARGVFDRFRTLWGGYVVTAEQREPPGIPTAQLLAAAANGDGAAHAAPSPPDQQQQQPQQPQRVQQPGPGRPLRFYFAGDTGYARALFREIGQRFGHIDLAAIPIGAYDPRWFMKPQHTDAEEGLQVALDVRASVSIGIHAATFCLTDEPMDEPPARLEAAVKAAALGPDTTFVTLQHGEKAVVVDGRLVNTPKTLPVAKA